jgi:hypothetical protein
MLAALRSVALMGLWTLTNCVAHSALVGGCGCTAMPVTVSAAGQGVTTSDEADDAAPSESLPRRGNQLLC